MEREEMNSDVCTAMPTLTLAQSIECSTERTQRAGGIDSI